MRALTSWAVDIWGPAIALIIVFCLFAGEAFKSPGVRRCYKNNTTTVRKPGCVTKVTSFFFLLHTDNMPKKPTLLENLKNDCRYAKLNMLLK